MSTSILFVGDSYTFGRVQPVLQYNAANVHDLTAPSNGGTFTNATGSNVYEPHPWGGVPGIFKEFTTEAGLDYDVSMSARNAASLRGHFLNSNPAGWDLRGNIGSQAWNKVVLQEVSDGPLPMATDPNGSPGFFTEYASLIADWIHSGKAQPNFTDTSWFGSVTAAEAATGESKTSANTVRPIPANPNTSPNAQVYLYETWARPGLVTGGTTATTDSTTGLVTGSTPGPDYYSSLQGMTSDLHSAYYGLLNTSPSRFSGVAPVGDAFQAAVNAGLATGTPYGTTPPADGKLHLWWDDELHASKWGSYLSGLTLYGEITGQDPRSLGASEQAASDLGISQSDAVTLQDVAAATLGLLPGAPTLALANDTGASGADGVTRDASLAAPGGVEPVDTLAYSLDGGATYTSTYAPPTEDGTYTLLVTQTDILGHTSSPGSLTFTLDTTAPVASSPADTVAQGSGPTPVGIAAPSDDLTAAGSLAIAAGSLPTDGTVTLADGTPVVSGQALTVQQLTGLLFTPAAGVYGQGSTFAYTVTDAAGNVATGTAALNVGGPGAPAVAGTHVTQDAAEAPVAPFAGVTVSDPSGAAGATETLTIQLTSGGGTLSEGAGYAGPLTLAGGNGAYTLAGTAAQVTAELDALSFTPAAGGPGTTNTTGFVLTDQSTSGTSVVDGGTSVTDTAAPAPPPAPIPDAVAIFPIVTYASGVFTLTGAASSRAGVGSVEISAVVDGARQDLGAATVNADGTFTFQDAVGTDQQSSFVATLTDGAGGQATSADPGFNLVGGLGPNGGTGKEESFGPDGSASTALFRPNGQRSVSVGGPGQVVGLQPYDVTANHHQGDTTFVFTPGEAIDVISGFKVGGADHDTIVLPSADFRNFAAVLRDTGDVNGSAFITDPKTGDAIRLAGVTTAELKAHPKDFSFI